MRLCQGTHVRWLLSFFFRCSLASYLVEVRQRGGTREARVDAGIQHHRLAPGRTRKSSKVALLPLHALNFMLYTRCYQRCWPRCSCIACAEWHAHAACIQPGRSTAACRGIEWLRLWKNPHMYLTTMHDRPTSWPAPKGIISTADSGAASGASPTLRLTPDISAQTLKRRIVGTLECVNAVRACTLAQLSSRRNVIGLLKRAAANVRCSCKKGSSGCDTVQKLTHAGWAAKFRK